MLLGKIQILARRQGASYCCVTIDRYFMHGYPGRLGSDLLLRPTYRTTRGLMTCQIGFIIMSKIEKKIKYQLNFYATARVRS